MSSGAQRVNSFNYTLRQKLYAPVRRWRWRRKRSPFLFRGERGIVLTLVPGEYVDGEIYVHGIYEYRLLRLLAQQLWGGVYVDVGANIGNHALYLADSFDKVVCFEPNPPIVARLNENIALSGKKNIEVRCVGLGDRNAEIPFRHNNRGNAGGGTFVVDETEMTYSLPVRVGDEILQDIVGVTLIKIDVEGFERAVFLGLRGMISRERPIIVFEFDGRHHDSSEWTDILGVLPGYRFAELAGIPGVGVRKLLAALQHGVRTRLIEMLSPEPRFYENIIAFPSLESMNRFGAVVS